MDTILMNYKNSGTSDPHKVLLNLTDKTNSVRSDKYIALSNLSIYYKWKNIKKVIQKTMQNLKLKIQNISSDVVWRIWITWWIIFCIRYQRLFWTYPQKSWKNVDNPSIRIYMNKIENRK